MSESLKANTHYQWHVVKARESELEEALNRLEQDWEIFSVTPTIHFGKRVMGAPVPSEILYTIVARRNVRE